MAAEAEQNPASLWLRADLEEPQSVRLPGGDAVVFALGHDPGSNQDAVCVAALDDHRALLAVADGAGGQAAGGKASEIAVRRVLSEAHAAIARDGAVSAGILAGFDAANRAILELGVGAASTLAVIEIEDRVARSYHAGDSAVLVTGQRGRLKLLTIAHSPVGYAQEAGVLTEQEALHHEDRHVVSNMLGTSEMRIEVGPAVTLAPRDTLVLGSDGLFDNLTVDEVAECVRKGPLARAAARLAGRALQRMEGPAPDLPSKPDDLGFLLYRPGGSE
ncbi:MAG: protein phosphatase 2C domain-containing protein [Myxococcales bacterium]|jgi:serine/threonine protein phosphatase PrpC